MANRTSFNEDKSAVAEAGIASAVYSINQSVAEMRSLFDQFQAAAGTDQKNGNLKAQSQTAQQNNQQRGQSTTKAAEHDQLAAADARGTYLNNDSGNASSINTVDVPGGAH